MIERFNVSKSLSELTDFSELDCRIDTEKLIDGNFVAEFFDEFFGSFFFFCSSFTLNAKNPLVNKFDSYNKLMASNLKSQLDVMKSAYNPIENYDSNEESTTTVGAKEENFNKGTNTDTTEVGQGQITTKSDVTSYESNTFAEADKVTTDESARTTTTTLGERTDIRTEKEHIDTFKKRIHGNIGVTTSQQMVESELELRKRNVITEYLTEFATMYFFIDDEGVEIWQPQICILSMMINES